MMQIACESISLGSISTGLKSRSRLLRPFQARLKSFQQPLRLLNRVLGMPEFRRHMRDKAVDLFWVLKNGDGLFQRLWSRNSSDVLSKKLGSRPRDQ